MLLRYGSYVRMTEGRIKLGQYLFLRHGGKYFDVKDPKANNVTKPDGLNDKLEIVGRYTNSAGATLGFKATTK